MIPSQRPLFDISDDVAYFNCAYMGPFLKTVRAAGHKGIDRKSLPWTVSPADFLSESEKAPPPIKTGPPPFYPPLTRMSPSPPCPIITGPMGP